MNQNAMIQRGVERNLRLLGVKSFDAQAKMAGLTAADRPLVERTLRSWYGKQGIDPLQFEAKVQEDVGKLFGGV